MNAQASPLPSISTATFDNGKTAPLYVAPGDASPADILTNLGIEPPQALLLVIGGAGSLDRKLQRRRRFRSRLIQLFSRGIARAAIDANALILDGGTHSGVMKLMGQGVADREHKTTLLGVTPVGKARYPEGPALEDVPDAADLDPEHTHFVLAGDDWGDETETMISLAQHIAEQEIPVEAKPSTTSKPPVVAVLVGSHEHSVAKIEALRSVRNRWPVLVLAGSGGLADKIVRLTRRKKRRERAPKWLSWLIGLPDRLWSQADPALVEIIEEGDIHVHKLGRPIKELQDHLSSLLTLPSVDPPLREAWKQFAVYDANAERHQKAFHRIQRWILRLGVLGTFLALSQTSLQRLSLRGESVEWISSAAVRGIVGPTLMQVQNYLATARWSDLVLDWGLRQAILVASILVTLLVALVNKFTPGNKWILLRATAEAVKREIYAYRIGTGKYRPSSEAANGIAPEAQLAEQVETIGKRLMRTEVNMSALRPYRGTIPPKMYGAAAQDDGLSPMSAEEYVKVRLGDQISYFDPKTNHLDRQYRRCKRWILIFGSIGTLLAAIGAELWIAMTTALAAALTTFLDYQQTENTLMRYNQTQDDLISVRNWWLALSDEEKGNPETVDALVELTEEILRTEQIGWVQAMEDTLAELRAKQGKEEGKQPDGDGGPEKPPAFEDGEPETLSPSADSEPQELPVEAETPESSPSADSGSTGSEPVG